MSKLTLIKIFVLCFVTSHNLVKKYPSLGRSSRFHIQSKFDKWENIGYSNNARIGSVAAD